MLPLNVISQADSTQVLAVLLDIFAKSILLLLAAGIGTRLLRRRSAAHRHLVWTMALIGLMCMPLSTALVPQVRLPILPGWLGMLPEPVAATPAGTNSPPEQRFLAGETGLSAVPLHSPGVEDSAAGPTPAGSELRTRPGSSCADDSSVS